VASVPGEDQESREGRLGPSRLDRGTKLGAEREKRLSDKGFAVRAKLYDTAKEAVVYVVVERQGEPDPSRVPDEEESRRKAGQRAACKVRRFCKANGISRLWTLTYAVAVESRAQVMADVAEFARKLQGEFGRMPYVYVPERGSKGRLHAHFGLGRYVPKERIAELWGHGYVDARRLGPDNAAAGRCAHYLSKYVGKSFSDKEIDEGHDRAKGDHRYEVAQGFQPVPLELEGDSLAEVRDEVVRLMGPPSSWWSSSECDSWYGPPVWVLMWDSG